MLALRLADSAPLVALRSVLGAPQGAQLLELVLALVTGAAVVAYYASRDVTSARRAALLSLLVIMGTVWSAATRGVAIDPMFPLLSLAVTTLGAAAGLQIDRHRSARRLRRTFADGLARPHLATLADSTASQAQLREVTVLRAAWNTLAAPGEDPAASHARVARMLAPLAGRLREAGAYVTTESDGSLTAVWNAPLDQPAHAALACRAALALRPLADSLAINLTAGSAAPAIRLGVGVGVASGPALVTCLGGASRPTYAVLGDAQAHARRLQRETLARGLPALVSPATARAAPELAALPLIVDGLLLMGDEAVARAREFRALKPLLAELEANLKINARIDVAALLDELGKRPWPALWPPLAPLLAHYRARADDAPRIAHSA
jgi:adenylate cyclase